MSDEVSRRQESIVPRRPGALAFGGWGAWVAVWFLAMGSVHGATYYVDFEAGSDSNSGLATTTAWKRCPGDPNAVGIPAGTQLKPGDTVLFRGGVTYWGKVRINASGSSQAPVVFKGDGWGTGKARVVGAERWQPTWTQAPSASFCLGNTNYQRIYYATAPASVANFRTAIYEDGQFLWFSQGPDVPDPFHYDTVTDLYRIPRGSSTISQTRGSVTDTTRFTQTDPAFWNGAYVMTWVQGNVTVLKAVTSFNPSTRTLYHEDAGANPYTDRDGYYSVLNHVSLISRPGEYAYDPAQNRVYLWPRNSDNPSSHEYVVQVLDTAFYNPAYNYVTVEGFEIRHFMQGIQADSGNSIGMVVRNNDLGRFRCLERYAIHVAARGSLVELNRVNECQRGVGILSATSDIVVRSNLVSRTSRQGIWFLGVTRGQIVNNVVTDILGTHANAVSIYSSSSDILVAHNQILRCNLPITYEASANVTFFGNLVDAGGRNHAANDWFGTSGRIAFINNSFVNCQGDVSVAVNGATSAQYVFLNNILDGSATRANAHDYNLLVGPFGSGWTLTATESSVAALSDVFRDPGAGDWRPKSGSLAVNTGTDPSASLPLSTFPTFDFGVDLIGIPRGVGGGWDRGAFELDSRPAAPTGLRFVLP